MTREEKISYASKLLQQAGVDFKIGKVSYESMGSKNPALDSAAKQFNDALLDKQAKKIEAYRKQLARLSKVLRKKNDEIEKLSAESSKHLISKVHTLYENQEMKKEYAKSLKEKDEVIDDISHELRVCNQKIEELIASIKGYQKKIAALEYEKKLSKKSRPTEDNPEEIEIKDAVKRIEKALKSGKTVIIDDEASAIGVKSLPADFCKVVDDFFWEMVD